MKRFLSAIVMAVFLRANSQTSGVVNPTNQATPDKIGTSFFIFVPPLKCEAATADNVSVAAATLGTFTPSTTTFRLAPGTLARAAANAVSKGRRYP